MENIPASMVWDAISCKSDCHSRLSYWYKKGLELTIICITKNRPEVLYKQAKVALDS